MERFTLNVSSQECLTLIPGAGGMADREVDGGISSTGDLGQKKTTAKEMAHLGVARKMPMLWKH